MSTRPLAERAPSGFKALSLRAMQVRAQRIDLLVKGIGELVTAKGSQALGGVSLGAVERLSDAAVAIHEGLIVAVGRADELSSAYEAAEVIDACGAADPEGPSVQLTIEVLGHRPGGHTPSETPLLRAAVAATRHVGAEPLFTASSTDANVPMSVGIPAVTVGGGGEAGKAHTTEEWYRNTKGVEGVQRALYTLLLAAGVAG